MNLVTRAEPKTDLSGTAKEQEVGDQGDWRLDPCQVFRRARMCHDCPSAPMIRGHVTRFVDVLD